MNLQVVDIDWTPIGPDVKKYLLINSSPEMVRDSQYQENMEFWKQLFPC